MAPCLRRRLSPLLIPLLAAGCATSAEPEGAALLRDLFASSQASLAALGPPPAPAEAPAGPDRPAAAAPVGGAPAPAPRPAVPAPDPAPLRRLATLGPPPRAAAELLGLTPEALRQRLGEPSLRRREGIAEVWLYAAEACALDLILYGESAGTRQPAGLRVAHAAARAAGAAPRTEADCLAEIAGGGVAAGPARIGGMLREGDQGGASASSVGDGAGAGRRRA